MPFAEMAGHRIGYLRAGRGAGVLLLHGLGVDARSWASTIAALEGAYDVAAPDIPGLGAAKVAGGLRDFDALCRLVVGFMDAVGFERPAVVGHSLGGFLALHLALAHPDRVSRLVLVDPAGLGRETALLLRLSRVPLLGGAVVNPIRRTGRAIMRQVFRESGDPDTLYLKTLHDARVVGATARRLHRSAE